MAMKQKRRAVDRQKLRITIRYVRSQLATMYGSTRKALRQIGRQKYRDTVNKVLEHLPANPTTKGRDENE
jgi:hypothetical protein